MAATEPIKLGSSLPQSILKNLRESGLSDETIELSGIRQATSQDLPAGMGVSGYVIPFFTIKGERNNQFTRTRNLLPGADPKYRQPPKIGQHAYLPPNVPSEVWADPTKTLIIVEGEKKALKLAQEGYNCLGLTGVFAWRQRTYRFKRSNITDELPNEIVFSFTNESDIHIDDQICEELSQINFDGRRVLICFDTDALYNDKVQSAAFELCLLIYERGGDPYQVILPKLDGEKTGPDDFFVKREKAVGIEQARAEFSELTNGRLTFPVAPNLISWIMKTKTAAKSKRSVSPKIARAIIASLDANGQRFRNTNSGEFYYLSETDRFKRGLHTFALTNRALADLRNITFGCDILIGGYHIGTNEKEILSEVGDLYATVQPIKDARPRRVCYTNDDAFYFQVNDVTSLKVTKDTIEEVPNGQGVLFYGMSKDYHDLNLERFYPQFNAGYKGMWLDALKDFEIQNLYSLNKRQTRFLIAAVFHLTPWLRQWRGLRPPIEQAIGEAGSGKTFLYQLRRGIMTGYLSLDAIGNDMKDWVATISAAPGQWVGDNLNSLIRNMRDEVQNSMARLVTDVDPHVDARILFSDNRLAKFPVDCTFAITSIRSPFNQPDIIQRSFVYHLRTIPAGRRNGTWVTDQLKNREGWVAEHIWAIQRFFQIVDKKWDWNYQSGHRLVNFEQSIYFMLQVLGMAADEAKTVIDALPMITNEEIVINDSTHEALREFTEQWYAHHTDKLLKANDIVNWAQTDVEGAYNKVYQLTNPSSLGRWMKSNATIIEQSAGLVMVEHGSQTFWRPIDPAQRGRKNNGD